jgi:ornithine cyclodeaminase/alanine dehydrogenase-like protein (mu-crystallin family)
VTATNDLLVLGRDELASLEVSWPEIVDVLEEAFLQKARGLVQNPPKPALHPRPDSFINAMPAYLGGADRAGLKWIAGYESNRAKGLPYINGIFVLTDAETGRSLAIMDGGWITEMRTAGVSGVVLRQVPVQPRTVAIVGAGAQARRHLEMLLELQPSVEEVRAFDAAPAASEALLALAETPHRVVVDSPLAAVEGADLVITVLTKMLSPRLTCENTAPDALLVPVDYEVALDPRASEGAVLYAVDDLAQYLANVAEHFEGYREPDGELADVVAGTLAVPASGRRMFLNMGIAMDDVAFGALCYDRALARRLGRTIAFP